MPQKQGKIIPNGVSLQKHENDTVVFFTERGFDIELIPASHIRGQRTPDFHKVPNARRLKVINKVGKIVDLIKIM